MKKLISLTLSIIMLISLSCITPITVQADTASADTVKYISNLQNNIPPAIPAQKVQLAWLAAGAGNTIENYARPADFTAETIAQFSYQFENHDGSLRGRVQGDNGDVRIFALRTDINTRNNHPVHTYRQVSSASSLAYERDVFDFAWQFVQHFDTITAVGHDHGNHTAHRPDTIRESAERFPLDSSRSVATATSLGTLNEDTIVFTYSRDDLGGMMSAMVYKGEVKHVSNLQNSIPPPLPAQKVQLAWIARGSGNTDENFASNGITSANFTNAANNGTFSYEFQNTSGSLKGRVTGDNGTVRIFALRTDINPRNNLPVNTYAEVRKVGDDYFRGATGTTAATAHEASVYNFAMQYVEHFATISEAGHDHGNHTAHKPQTIRESAERFPFTRPISDFASGGANHVATGNNALNSIVFTYSRDDLGGLMNAMVLTVPDDDDCGDPDCTHDTYIIKHISNLQNNIPAAIPAQKVQLAWIARGAGNTDANFSSNGETSANFTNVTNNGTFSYEFNNGKAGTERLAGRVTGDDGTVRIFALRTDINARNNLPVNTYAEVRKVGDEYFRGATGITAATAHEAKVYDFAMQFIQYFGTITEFQHDHANHTTFKPDTIRESAERFPFERGISATANPEQTIVFTYSRDDLGGMMSAMVLTSPILSQVAAPTASASGSSTSSSRNITLSSATADATIYYTTNGSDPTTSSTKYENPFPLDFLTVGASHTVSAIAVKEGMSNSEVMTVTFTRSSSSGGGITGGGNPSIPSTPGTTPTVTAGTSTWNLTSVPRAALTALNLSSAIPVSQIRVAAGQTGNVNVAVGADFAGQNAVLVRFNTETGELEFVSAATVGTNGNATVNVAAAGDFLVLTFKTGDVTGTGKVEAADALAVLRHAVGLTKLNGIQTFVANGRSGDVGTNDALNILRIAIGLTPVSAPAPTVTPPPAQPVHTPPSGNTGNNANNANNGNNNDNGGGSTWCEECGEYH